MKKLIGLFMVLALSVGAESYTIFVHGKSGTYRDGVGTVDINSYWGAAANVVSGSKIFVSYDGTTDPRTYGTARAQTNLSKALTTYCKTGNTCKIICHSAGCYATEYWLSTALGGGSASASGFNITKVTALAAASGGSELASTLDWISLGFVGNAMDKALIVSTARGAYNHNNTGGVGIYHVPGYKGMIGASAVLPGEDDYAVAFHSACGYSKVGGLDYCQSSLTQYEGVWPFGGNVTYTQYSGHYRAPSLTSTGLYKDHGEIKDEGNR